MKCSHNKSGFITVLVLCIVILIAAILTAFTSHLRGVLRSTERMKHSLEAQANARSGLHIALAMIESEPNRLPEFIDSPGRITLPGGYCQIRVEPENGKINLNSLIDQQGKADPVVIAQLGRLIYNLNAEKDQADPEIDPAIIPAIIDWIDEDDEVTTFTFGGRTFAGAEADFYRSKGYRPANARLTCMSQLEQIRGITPGLVERIEKYVTVYGSGQIDINSAPAQVLRALADDISEETVNEIIARRNLEPFGDVNQLKQIRQITDDIFSSMAHTLTARRSRGYYSVRVKGRSSDYSSKIKAVIDAGQSPAGTSAQVIKYDEL